MEIEAVDKRTDDVIMKETNDYERYQIVMQLLENLRNRQEHDREKKNEEEHERLLFDESKEKTNYILNDPNQQHQQQQQINEKLNNNHQLSMNVGKDEKQIEHNKQQQHSSSSSSSEYQRTPTMGLHDNYNDDNVLRDVLKRSRTISLKGPTDTDSRSSESSNRSSNSFLCNDLCFLNGKLMFDGGNDNDTYKSEKLKELRSTILARFNHFNKEKNDMTKKNDEFEYHEDQSSTIYPQSTGKMSTITNTNPGNLPLILRRKQFSDYEKRLRHTISTETLKQNTYVNNDEMKPSIMVNDNKNDNQMNNIRLINNNNNNNNHMSHHPQQHPQHPQQQQKQQQRDEQRQQQQQQQQHEQHQNSNTYNIYRDSFENDQLKLETKMSEELRNSEMTNHLTQLYQNELNQRNRKDLIDHTINNKSINSTNNNNNHNNNINNNNNNNLLNMLTNNELNEDDVSNGNIRRNTVCIGDVDKNMGNYTMKDEQIPNRQVDDEQMMPRTNFNSLYEWFRQLVNSRTMTIDPSTFTSMLNLTPKTSNNESPLMSDGNDMNNGSLKINMNTLNNLSYLTSTPSNGTNSFLRNNDMPQLLNEEKKEGDVDDEMNETQQLYLRTNDNELQQQQIIQQQQQQQQPSSSSSHPQTMSRSYPIRHPPPPPPSKQLFDKLKKPQQFSQEMIFLKDEKFAHINKQINHGTNNKLVPLSGSSNNYYCTRLPSHWRYNKRLPQPFMVLCPTQIDNLDGQYVVIEAGNDHCQKAQLKNNVTQFRGTVAIFSDLRFMDKSGRGKLFTLNINVHTYPPQILRYNNAIKITVDGPRLPRRPKRSYEPTTNNMTPTTSDHRNQMDQLPSENNDKWISHQLPFSTCATQVNILPSTLTTSSTKTVDESNGSSSLNMKSTSEYCSSSPTTLPPETKPIKAEIKQEKMMKDFQMTDDNSDEKESVNFTTNANENSEQTISSKLINNLLSSNNIDNDLIKRFLLDRLNQMNNKIKNDNSSTPTSPSLSSPSSPSSSSSPISLGETTTTTVTTTTTSVESLMGYVDNGTYLSSSLKEEKLEIPDNLIQSIRKPIPVKPKWNAATNGKQEDEMQSEEMDVRSQLNVDCNNNQNNQNNLSRQSSGFFTCNFNFLSIPDDHHQLSSQDHLQMVNSDNRNNNINDGNINNMISPLNPLTINIVKESNNSDDKQSENNRLTSRDELSETQPQCLPNENESEKFVRNQCMSKQEILFRQHLLEAMERRKKNNHHSWTSKDDKMSSSDFSGSSSSNVTNITTTTTSTTTSNKPVIVTDE
ncbi:hypothetical protein SNEBB_006187 [Seison nebaliae]|nr:hypothetical protein SNEBB_006187 [Seison nebaliae]